MIKKKIAQYLFNEILKIRIIEEEIANRYKDQKMRCPVHLSIGQESVAVNVSYYLNKNDCIYSNHRSHAHYIARGCDIYKFICELHGKRDGCANGRGGSMHIKDLDKNFIASIPLVGSALGLAVGTALHFKRKKKKSRVCVYFGDGSAEEGILHEALNFISLYDLPIILICENNLYSVYTHQKDRSISSDFVRFAKNFKIKSQRVKTNNIFQSITETKKIFDYSQNNLKPIFIQFDTYRHREHCGPNFDDHLNYRSKSEVKSFLKKCPVILSQKYLRQNYNINDKYFKKLENEIKQKIEEMFKLAEKSNFPNPNTASHYVYSE
jgi:pyruvate dehydrogenase E1 component alpha subunit